MFIARWKALSVLIPSMYGAMYGFTSLLTVALDNILPHHVFPALYPDGVIPPRMYAMFFTAAASPLVFGAVLEFLRDAQTEV